jgi:hypothetical protein
MDRPFVLDEVIPEEDPGAQGGNLSRRNHSWKDCTKEAVFMQSSAVGLEEWILNGQGATGFAPACRLCG